MIADFHTKPLQGSLFRKMRDILMGIAPFPEEERVGAREKVSVEVKSSDNRSDPVSRNLGTTSGNEKVVMYADAVRCNIGG